MRMVASFSSAGFSSVAYIGVADAFSEYTM